jgi:parallel beta-helix repeat protein
MTRARSLIAAMLGLLPLLPACFIGSTGGPPWTLDGVPLPNDENSIQRTIDAMSTFSAKYDLTFLPGDREPPSLFALRPLGLEVYRVDAGGHLGVGRESSEWGDEWAVAGIPVPMTARGGLSGDAALGFLRDFTERAEAGGGRVEAQKLEPGVDVAWVATELAGTHGLVWGAPASPWVFEAAAETQTAVANLVRAFAEAARAANRDQAFTGSADLAGSTLLVSSDTTLRIDHQGSVEVEADDVTLDCTGHTVSGPGTRAEDEYGFIGILLDGRTGVTVKNCRVSGFDYGILLTARLGSGSDGNRLVDNTASENFLDGIRFNESKHNVLTGNIASSNGQHGFAFEGNANVVTGNEAFDNELDGFVVGEEHRDIVFSANLSKGNQAYGFAIVGTGHTLVRNTAANNGGHGFWIAGNSISLRRNRAVHNGVDGFASDEGSRHISLYRNTSIGNRDHGFGIVGAGHTLVRNTAANGENGFGIADSSISVRQNRAVRNGDQGFWIAGDSISVRRNLAVHNGVDGFAIDRGSRHIAFYGNTSIGNRDHGFGITGTGHTFVRNKASENGLVGFAVDPRGGANTFERNEATGNRIHGFQVADSRGNTFIRNTAANNGAVGFSLELSARQNALYRNIARHNGEDGFRTMQDSIRNTFERNVALDNLWTGFRAEAGPNLFSNNRACKNGEADALDVGSDNRWRNNAFCALGAREGSI